MTIAEWTNQCVGGIVHFLLLPFVLSVCMLCAHHKLHEVTWLSDLVLRVIVGSFFSTRVFRFFSF